MVMTLALLVYSIAQRRVRQQLAQQQETLPFLLDKASDASLKFVSDGITSAMNEFNQKDI